jgi:hypothetical protein
MRFPWILIVIFAISILLRVWVELVGRNHAEAEQASSEVVYAGLA